MILFLWRMILLTIWFCIGYHFGKQRAKYPDANLFYIGSDGKKYKECLFGIYLGIKNK